MYINNQTKVLGLFWLIFISFIWAVGISQGKIQALASDTSHYSVIHPISTSDISHNFYSQYRVADVSILVQRLAVTSPTFSIPSIGLHNIQAKPVSLNRMDELDRIMLSSPVYESEIAASFCTDQQNSYLMGHSEPPTQALSKYPAVNIFSRLDQVRVGQIITAQNQFGDQCVYQVSEVFMVPTKDGEVSNEVFASLFRPQDIPNSKYAGRSTLTIQTCLKGSADIRYFVRAIRLN
jgi:sortase (surface protein transpeptidase)